jgi:hypothetical protein
MATTKFEKAYLKALKVVAKDAREISGGKIKPHLKVATRSHARQAARREIPLERMSLSDLRDEHDSATRAMARAESVGQEMNAEGAALAIEAELERRGKPLHEGGNPRVGRQHTVRVTNTISGHQEFKGHFDNERDAFSSAKREAKRSSGTIFFEVFTGSPENPGKPTKLVTSGHK